MHSELRRADFVYIDDVVDLSLDMPGDFRIA